MGLLNKFRKEGKKKSYEEEVLENLASILNAKQGYCAWQKGLGLKSYCNNKSHSDVVEEIISDIQYNISHFEKRIKVVEIEPIKNEGQFNLSFQIKCQLGGVFHSFYIGFNQFEDSIRVEVDQ